MQKRVAIWILGAFKTSPSSGVEAIAGLILINLHLKKLSRRSQLRVHSLPSNHILCLLMEPRDNTSNDQHLLSLSNLTRYQYQLIKESVVDMDNHFNEVYPSFNPLYPELSPGNRIIDTFSDHFSFHPFSECKNNIKEQIQKLDNLAIESSESPTSALVITDASIKNNIVMYIAHIHIHNHLITKTLHHTMNVTSTEAKLFAIRCGINQAINTDNISKVKAIMDSLHSAKKIFDPSLHSYQSYSNFILKELQIFFSQNQENTIKLWECPSHSKWHLHDAVNKNTKSFSPVPLLPCKQSWDFSKKSECDDIIKTWKMTFQASDSKGKHFLDLVDSDDNPIEPSYIRGGSWLKFFGHSNSLCARASRAITNHAPIGEYRLRFFPREDFSCLCGSYPIESRSHILHECKRFNNYWNPRRDSISHFVLFLELNLGAFAFHNDSI